MESRRLPIPRHEEPERVVFQIEPQGGNGERDEDSGEKNRLPTVSLSCHRGADHGTNGGPIQALPAPHSPGLWYDRLPLLLAGRTLCGTFCRSCCAACFSGWATVSGVAEVPLPGAVRGH